MLLVDQRLGGLIGRLRHDDGERHGRAQDQSGIVLTEAQKRARRARSIAIAVSLGALVVLFYVVTLVKGPGVLDAAAVRHADA